MTTSVTKRSIGVIARLLTVLFAVGSIHVMARVISSHHNPEARATPASCGEFDGPPCEYVEPAWHTYVAEGWPEHVMYHVFGAVSVLVAGMVLTGFFMLICWISGIKLEDPDPCDKPDTCPCKRHDVERRQQELAQAAMMGGAAGAVSASIISSG